MSSLKERARVKGVCSPRIRVGGAAARAAGQGGAPECGRTTLTRRLAAARVSDPRGDGFGCVSPPGFDRGGSAPVLMRAVWAARRTGCQSSLRHSERELTHLRTPTQHDVLFHAPSPHRVAQVHARPHLPVHHSVPLTPAVHDRRHVPAAHRSPGQPPPLRHHLHAQTPQPAETHAPRIRPVPPHPRTRRVLHQRIVHRHPRPQVRRPARTRRTRRLNSYQEPPRARTPPRGPGTETTPRNARRLPTTPTATQTPAP